MAYLNCQWRRHAPKVSPKEIDSFSRSRIVKRQDSTRIISIISSWVNKYQYKTEYRKKEWNYQLPYNRGPETYSMIQVFSENSIGLLEPQD